MFEEKLIEVIKRNPCLYDKSSKFYKNKFKKDQTWLEVASVVGKEVEQCQCRWKSLRDRFLKELYKMSKSESAAPDENDWMFFSAMQFLQPHVTRRRYNAISKTEWNFEKVMLGEPSSSSFFNCTDGSPATEHVFCSTPKVSYSSADIPSTSAGAQKREMVEQATERFDTLVGTVEDLLSAKVAGAKRKEDSYKSQDGDANLFIYTDGAGTPEHIFSATPEVSHSSADIPLKSAGSRKRKTMDQATERFDSLVGTVKKLLSVKAARASRNEDFYKVLDGYLLKLPPDKQDRLKFEMLKMVVEECKL